MKTKAFFAVVIILWFSAFSGLCASAEDKYNSIPIDWADSTAGKFRYQSELTIGEIKKARLWNTEKEKLPISLKKLTTKAEEFVSRKISENDAQNKWAWKVLKIDIKDVGAESKPMWYFQILFLEDFPKNLGNRGGSTGPPPSISLFANMDGEFGDLKITRVK